jgi:hypothetical protein
MENEQALQKRDDSLPFKLMDALDDQLIIAELEGRMPEVLTYHFSDKGQEVWGLSKAGVDEATGELAKQGEVIRELELTFVDGKEEAYFTVKAGRYVISKGGQEVLLDTKFGTKRQPKKTPRGNDNSFWYEQGSIKACRNASMRLIPKTIVQAVIENAKKVGKVKEVKPEPQKTPEPEKSLEEIHAESASKCSAISDEMLKIDNMVHLKNKWVKYSKEWKKDLLPEHYASLETLKDQMKTKFEEVKHD